MLLGAKLAWPHLEENARLIKVDNLRKAVGKKNQQKILEIGKEFVDGCLHNNIDVKVANIIFETIKASGRYAFNLSHAMAYAYLGYQTAYYKCHYPLEFLSTYLSYAEERLDKWQEIKDIYSEMCELRIPLLPPNFNKRNLNFSIEGDGIRYGLRHIKAVGSQIEDFIHNVPDITEWRTWLKLCFTTTFGFKMREPTARALILSGAFSDTKLTRKLMINIYNHIKELSPKELGFVLDNLESVNQPAELCNLLDRCKEEVSTKKRHSIIDSIIQLLTKDLENSYDDPSWIEQLESEYLGIILTATSLDKKSIIAPHSITDCYGDHPMYTNKCIKGVIDDVKIRIIKSGSSAGKQMALISVRDGTGILSDIPVFSELFEHYSSILRKNNILTLSLNKGKKGWIVNEISLDES